MTVGIKEINITSSDKILDYITNLKQEINKLTAESTEWESKYYDLQQENKILKIQNNNLKKILESRF